MLDIEQEGNDTVLGGASITGFALQVTAMLARLLSWSSESIEESRKVAR
jgi:hypothetical protein